MILAPRVFGNPRSFDFDHIGSSLLILFEILSLEGWTEVRDVLESINPPWGIIFIHLYVFLAGKKAKKLKNIHRVWEILPYALR